MLGTGRGGGEAELALNSHMHVVRVLLFSDDEGEAASDLQPVREPHVQEPWQLHRRSASCERCWVGFQKTATRCVRYVNTKTETSKFAPE